MNGGLGVSPTSNWRLDYRFFYDLSDGKFTHQQVGLRRDLHEWQADFFLALLPGSRLQINFRIFLVEVPALSLPFTRREE